LLVTSYMWPEDADAKHKGRDPATPHPDEARDTEEGMPPSSGIRLQICGRLHKRAYSIEAERSGEGLGHRGGAKPIVELLLIPEELTLKLPNTRVKLFRCEADFFC
jgi:hypothetical protein